MVLILTQVRFTDGGTGKDSQSLEQFTTDGRRKDKELGGRSSGGGDRAAEERNNAAEREKDGV